MSINSDDMSEVSCLKTKLSFPLALLTASIHWRYNPIFMRILKILLLLSTLISASTLSAASEETMKNSVLKLKTYDRETVGGNYYFSHWGSAVAIEGNKILTNAHVILNADGDKPTGLYEVCRSVATKRYPVCFSVAKLISYDTVADLALLELTVPAGKDVVTYSPQSLSIGSKVITYGYPAIGGTNVTRTEGKIGGTEGENYKFDGTIDRGNSWGGAFDQDGKLVGIPYAVSSDNGVIGYIIPVSTIRDFLAGKTYDIQKYSSSLDKAFASYISNIQKLFQSTTTLKTKYVTIKDFSKAGFSLKTATESKDRSIFDYRFIDKLERVAIMVSCSRDASWLKSSQELAEISLREKGKSTLMTYTGKYLDNKKQYYISTLVAKDATNGQKLVGSTIFSKDAPMCASYIIANDGFGKDRALYDKAVSLIQWIKFSNQKSPTKKYVSSFFQIESLPENVYISEGTSVESLTILPQIYMSFGFGEYSTLGTLDVYTFKKRDDYMNIGYASRNYYQGETYTFSDFYNRYKTLTDATVRDQVIESKNGKKMVFTTIDESTSEIPRTKVIVFYPFKTQAGEYKAYQAVFQYETRNGFYITELESFFKSLDLPGTSPFTP